MDVEEVKGALQSTFSPSETLKWDSEWEEAMRWPDG